MERSSPPPGVIRPGLPRSSIATGRVSTATASAGPWLFGIATNLLRSRLRSETRRTRALARLHPQDEADLADGALDRVEAQALGPQVAAALSQLSPIYRDALLLHVWGDLSYEQVAEATHVSVGTVRSRIHRARTYVRAALRPEEILK
jgi:RNA polymerase sigma factor (sigma-70 family)